MIDADALFAWYARHGRRHLPWRQTRDPYRIVVSEFMLQQTQVDRVLPLYRAFLERFPSFEALADAGPDEVVRAWRGLGYNSRAVRLHRLARAVAGRYGGVLPREREALRELPGIGPYTAAAVRAFAFDESDAAPDTNVRRIVHRVLHGLEFPARATERDLDASARRAVPPARGHDWNSAMMDLGATICTSRAPKCLLCPLQPACAAAPVDPARLAALARKHTKRTPQESMPFERTRRFLRGRIIDRLRDLEPNEPLTVDQLRSDLAAVVPQDRLSEIAPIVEALARDGIVATSERGVTLCAM